MALPTHVTEECIAFRGSVAEATDRLPINGEHAASCAECRRYLELSRLLDNLASVPRLTPPAGFANRVVRQALRDRRVRAYRRVGAGLAVAAGLLLAVVMTSMMGSGPPSESAAFVSRNSAGVKPASKMAGEGSASVVAVRHDSNDDSGKNSGGVSPGESLDLTHALSAETESALDALATIPEVAQVGFEPVTNTARRAVALFLRDTGLSETSY